MARKNVKELWEALMEGEPEVDESQEITSAMINQQTMDQMAELSDEH